MLNKAVAVFLACLAFTLAAPATEDRTTTAVKGSQGQGDVQRLIEELERGHAPTKKDTVIKKTTITTVEKPTETLSDNSHVTITHLGNDRNNVVSSSEELLNKLKNEHSYESVSHTVGSHESGANPTVIVHKVPTTSSSHSEDWSEVHSSNNFENSAEFQQQAKNAHFQFATQVDDHINGNYQQKAETRQGGVLYGKYSYDDGFFWTTVYYKADKNGFVVTKREVLPTHMTQRTGDASVQTLMDGYLVDYKINENDIGSSKRQSPASSRD
ncbi:unnamed protein product [Psylliodes chrysocephalus]|uniref:Uncharacterized protein n=1 Tax=Psylliodes chrysocephalus TaxID=3402493 RepID=A0A9P0GFF1_9CUCU|nr:unnamed protein product [Psylliodes chrysocephala]